MCSENIQYSANNGSVTINTPNPNLNGTGPMSTVITASADGTLVKNVIIKSTGSTQQGMVRLFIDDGGGNIMLYREVMIPANVQTAVVPAFSASLSTPITLKSGFILKVATQFGDTFNIVATATDWLNCDCPSNPV